MPLPANLADELRDILDLFGAAHGPLAVPGGAGKALEAWVMMKLAEHAATTMTYWEVSLRRGDGSPLPSGDDFCLPGGPSGIPASNPTAPGYVLLEHAGGHGQRLELRGSLRWRGRSNARHECDISVVPAEIGEAIADNGGGYPHGLPIVAIECKDRTSLGELDETRETVARMFDLVLVTQPYSGWSCRIFESNTNERWGNKSSKYVSFFAKGTFGIARAGGFRAGAAQLADHYHVGRYGSIYSPGSNSLTRLLWNFSNTLHTIANF